MKLSCQDTIAPGSTLIEKLENLEKLRFEGIELWGRSQLGDRLGEIRETVASYKVKVSTICAGYSGDLLSPDSKQRSEAIEGISRRLEWARELDALGVIFVPTFGGPKLPDLSPLYRDVADLERRLLVAECHSLARIAEDLGVYAILEPLNRYETHLINRLEQGVEIIEEVGSDGLKLMADFFHMNIEERDISEALSKASKHIAHVHLADSNRLLPGHGHIDFSPIRTIISKGYKNYFSLECRIPGEPMGELRKFVEFISSFG